MRAVRWILAVVALLVAAWMLAVASGRLPRIDAADRAALDAVRNDPGPAGALDAFAALRLLGADVPWSEIERVAAADVAAAATRDTYVDWTDDARPLLPAPSFTDRTLCFAGEPCLARLRADPAPARATLEANAELLARADGLHAYDHYRDAFRGRVLHNPWLGVGGLRLQLTDAALRFVDGDAEGAFTRTCAIAATGRRLGARSNHMLVRMGGPTFAVQAAFLHAEMLAETDEPATVRGACDAAFRPFDATEHDLCAVIRSELRYAEASLGTIERRDSWQRRLQDPLFVHEHTMARLASRQLHGCDGLVLALPLAHDARPWACTTSEALFNPLGCTLASIPGDFREYHVRLRDIDAKLRLTATARWMAATPGASFDARPAPFRLQTHRMEHDAARRVLRVDALARQGAASWEIPVRTAPASGE